MSELLSPHSSASQGTSAWHLDQHRAALTGHCYRMLGSASEADDAVQETMVRAWRSLDRFEGRSSLRTWLYRIATRVCLDALASRGRRERPMQLGAPGTPTLPMAAARPASEWVEPIPDALALPVDEDPSRLLVLRQSIRLAFVAALQFLPPRQRAVLILREVLDWSAAEVAGCLEMSVAAVNSALQRARATLATKDLEQPTRPLSDPDTALLERYVDAFERYDLDALTALLHEDAVLSMPPFPLWLQGHADIRTWMAGPGMHCRGSRLLPTKASGLPAFGQYRPSGPGGRHQPWALIVLEISGDRIVGLNSFLDTTTLFPLFGLPPEPPPLAVAR